MKSASQSVVRDAAGLRDVVPASSFEGRGIEIDGAAPHRRDDFFRSDCTGAPAPARTPRSRRAAPKKKRCEKTALSKIRFETSSTPWLNAEQAAEYLALPSAKAVYEAVRRGEIPAHRLGERRLRFRREELDALLDSKRIGGNLAEVLFSGCETPGMPTEGRR